MKKLLMILGTAAVAASANAADQTGTVTTNGVMWTYSELNETAKTVTLGRYASDNDFDCAMPKDTSWNASEIPSSFVIDGETYVVTKFAARAFYYCTGLTGALRIPSSVTSLGGKEVFRYCSGLTRVASWGGLTALCQSFMQNCSNVEGPLPSFSGFTSLNKTSGADSGWAAFADCGKLSGVCVNVNATLYQRQFLRKSYAMKMLLVGPNVKLNYTSATTTADGGGPLSSVTGCNVVVPASLKPFTPSGTDNDIFYYGPQEDFNLSIDETARVVTATPATTNGLIRVLACAPLFKAHLGFDTRVNITNTLEMAEGTVTADMLNAVEFNTVLLTFKVKTQAALDSLLAAVPESTYPSLAIDPSGAKENLVLPHGRRIYVLFAGERTGTYKSIPNGLVISVK